MVILAGGRGTRLRAVVKDLPKVVVRVHGRPFIFYILDQLCGAGVRRVMLCTGYMANHVEEKVGKQYKTIEIMYSKEDSPLGTGGAIRKACDLTANEWVLAINGDSFVDIDYHDFVSWHIKKGAQFSVVVTPMENADRYGAVTLNADQEITDFVEKNTARATRSHLINAGIYLMHRSIPRTFPQKGNLSLEREILPSFIGKGVFGYRTKSAFIDIGTPESLKSANEFFKVLRRNIPRSVL